MQSSLFLVISLCIVPILCGPRFQPVVTVKDAHGEVRGKQVFLWMNRLSEVKDRVQMKYKEPKERLVLWYIPVDRDGYETATVYDLDDSETFAQVDSRYNVGRRGLFGVTMYR